MAAKKKKPPRKDATIRVRVDADQRTALADAAERAGLDVSSWLRALGLKEARKT